MALTAFASACEEDVGIRDVFDAFDPFADDEDFFVSEADVAPEAEPNAANAPLPGHRDPALPAAERIDNLFHVMSARRRVLMDTLRYAAVPRSFEEMVARIENFQKHDYAVYSASDYLRLLEEAGALCKTDGSGSPLISDTRRVPEIVVGADGREYYRPAEAPELHWLVTAEGAAVVEADAPLSRLSDLFAREERYVPIYRRVLSLCADKDGAATAEIACAVDDDPLLQDPRLMAPHFTDRLEQGDAIRWEGRWKITAIGRDALALPELATEN